MNAALEGGEWSAARPGRTLPPEKTRYPFYKRLGGPQGRSGRAENLVPTRIRSRTVQPVVSRYTDWATRPTQCVRNGSTKLYTSYDEFCKSLCWGMFPVNHLSEGLAMGVAISSIFSEICLLYFEYANIIDIITGRKATRYFTRGQCRLINKLFLTNTNSMSAECNNLL